MLISIRRHTHSLTLATVEPRAGRHVDTFLLIRRLLAICLVSALTVLTPSASVAWSKSAASPVGSVRALLETTPVPHGGDAADDAAIWVDTARPARSSIIATDKLGGLVVYDLSGRQLHYYADSKPNNVDLRAGFRLGGRRVSLVATSDRETDSIRVYVVEPSKRSLRYVAARPLSTGIGVAGLCMYRSARSGKYFAFVSDSSGTLQQWELFDNGKGRVESRKVRTLKLDSVTEGCVADDALGRLYVAQEDVGIWRYGAAASAGSARAAVDRVGANLTADIEGLALYTPKRGAGYLIASSQGSDTFALYRRSGSNRYVMSFRVIPGKVDGVTHTDGIAVVARGLGPRFRTGVFVAQDERNDGSDQNFKLVPWTSIARAAPHRTVAATVPSVAHRSYYVDSAQGKDANPGTSPERPWRSLEKASSASLAAGDRLLFSRRGTWTGTLRIDARGSRSRRVVVGAYGRGALPRLGGASSCLALTGTDVVVRELHLHDCSWAGIEISGSRNRVERTLVTGNAAGVYIKAGAVENAIVGNRLVDNNRMSVLTPSPDDDDAGAFGVLVHGDRNEIAYNTIKTCDAFSYDYGRDGAAIELYGARKNSVHHNLAIDNDTFAELGESRTAENTFAYNVVRSSLTQSVGLVTRGGTSGRGPVRNTRLFNNTIYLTGPASQGFVCHGGCAADILRMRNNIVLARAKVGYADGPLDEDYNLFFGGQLQFSRGGHSVVRDPGFVARARGNLRLRRASPAVDRGVDLGFRVDFDRRPARIDGNGDGRRVPDLGAFEYRRSRR